MIGDDGSSPGLQGLIMDWGGVLTSPLSDAMLAWSTQENVPMDTFNEVMRSWLGAPPATPAPDQEPGGPARLSAALSSAPPPSNSPVHELERGRLSPAGFEVLLAQELRARGVQVISDGLLTRMLAGFEKQDDDMLGLVRQARQAGIRTALLSNSWGDHYPEHLWAGAFDVVVISGRVGMRKPDREIFEHTAGLLGLSPGKCVMVDDLPRNVAGAVAAGMVGVLHRSFDETKTELDILLELPAS